MMRREGILWLFVTTFLLSTATQQDQSKQSNLNLDMAMTGYNPLMTDVMEQPDQGRRSALFTAWQRKSVYEERTENMINSFVDVTQKGRCTPSLTEAIVTNYEEYRHLSSQVISFATEGDAAATNGTAEFSFEENAGLGNVNNPNAALIRQHFDQHSGEARFVKVECVTHTVRISPFQVLVFTPAFQAALHVLNQAATDTNSGTRQNVFQNFVRYYGTHFARTTHFGYAAYFGRLYTTKATTTAANADRRKCMVESAWETLRPENRKGCVLISQLFSRVAVSKCGEDDLDMLVIETGSRSRSGVDDCGLVANMYPEPVAYTFAKISALFDENWRTSDLLPDRLNGTALAAFFEEYVGAESQDIITRAQTRSAKQPSWRRRFSNAIEDDPSEAVVKSSSSVEGGIIIVGGRKSDGRIAYPNSLALSMPPPAMFPVEVYGNTLSSIGSNLYSCGGNGTNGELCWHIDTSLESTWQSFEIPWNLICHSAVAVKDEIWFFDHSKLRIFHTRNTQNKFREISMEFSFVQDICTVTHGSKTFVIGVGSGRNQIYVNTDPSQPGQWELFSELLQGRLDFGCVVLGSEIFVTGGCERTSGPRLASAETINIATASVKSIGSLKKVREDHQMAIIQGKPAVLGGCDGNELADIEIYDEKTDSWEAFGYTLGEPRHEYGLTQYFH